MPILAAFRSTAKLNRSRLYQGIRNEVEAVLEDYEYGFYADNVCPVGRTLFRAVAWNLNNGHRYNGIIETLKNHPLISQADVFLFPGLDLGMPRSDFRNVARSLALELGYNYFFATSYLNTAAYRPEAGGTKALCLEGNAILSRQPISGFRIASLPPTFDPLKGRAKRLGCQKALFTDVTLGEHAITIGCVHLDTFSSPRQRARQARHLLGLFKGRSGPVLLGGDFNTTTFNSRRAVYLMAGFFNKLLRGADYILEEHVPYPERHFDQALFTAFSACGFDYKGCNELGRGTLPYKPENLSFYNPVHEILPHWSIPFFEKILKRYGVRAIFKPDWFMTAGGIRPSSSPQAEKPKVIPNLFHQGVPVSTHDPILFDFDVGRSNNGAEA